MIQPGSHRADIDGLRAFAVLLVVVFHINEALIPGGFIGVDMFFVISGFLITGNIVRDSEAGRFSYAEFYRRRIKRIFPAMFLVTGVTLLVGLAVLLPDDMERLSWSALATSLSAANIYFTWWLDTSYFAPDSRTVPLLHMWSLGVEEQFYIIWPALILALLKFRRALVPILIIMIVASIGFGQWRLSHDAVQGAYYMLPSRLFQLAAGGLLVFLPAVPIRAVLPAFLAGLAMIVWSAVMLTGASPFPGLNAVPVAFGTVLLLAAGTHPNLLSRAISIQPFRHIGEISYSLYLWHWPILAFQRYYYGTLSPVQQIGSFAAMLVLSELSYRLVETPLRRTTLPFRPVFIRQFAAPLTVITLAVAFILTTNGFGPWIWTDYPAQFAAYQAKMPRPVNSSPKVCQGFPLTPEMIEDPNCVIGKGKPTALLYGDSHAAHYIGLVTALGRDAKFTFRNFEHGACPPILDADPTPYTNRSIEGCAASQKLAREKFAEYDTIFVGAAWSAYARYSAGKGVDFEQSVRDFVSTLTAQDKKIVLLVDIPVSPRYRKECAGVSTPDCLSRRATSRRNDPFTPILYDIARTNPLVRVIDVTNMLCAKKRCFSYWKEQPLYYDALHLSLSGSYAVGNRFARSKEAVAIKQFVTEPDQPAQTSSY